MPSSGGGMGDRSSKRRGNHLPFTKKASPVKSMVVFICKRKVTSFSNFQRIYNFYPCKSLLISQSQRGTEKRVLERRENTFELLDPLGVSRGCVWERK
jgi:hypothetical protein